MRAWTPLIGSIIVLFLVACGDGTGSAARSSDRPPRSDGPSESTTVSVTSPAVTSGGSNPARATSIGSSSPVPPGGTVFDAGDFGAFTSPSGNIACTMALEYGASCWIAEKEWSIDEPAGPDCADFDFGNAVDITGSGPLWPCYSDFSWDAGAPPLAYGDAMVVGGFRCESARSGVTCRNDSGRGFALSRAEAVLF